MGGVAAVMSVFSMVQGYQASKEAANKEDAAAAEAERLAEANAVASEAETHESMRRTRRQSAAAEATAGAKAGASGVVGGSMGDAIASMITEHGTQLDWMKTSGASRANIIRKGGALTGMQGRAQADATRARGTSNLLKSSQTVYSSGKKADWWG